MWVVALPQGKVGILGSQLLCSIRKSKHSLSYEIVFPIFKNYRNSHTTIVTQTCVESPFEYKIAILGSLQWMLSDPAVLEYSILCRNCALPIVGPSQQRIFTSNSQDLLLVTHKSIKRWPNLGKLVQWIPKKTGKQQSIG